MPVNRRSSVKADLDIVHITIYSTRIFSCLLYAASWRCLVINADELMAFQHEQLRHDEIAHKDILCLPVHARIKHMVLHFAKYSGRLVEARERQDYGLMKHTVVDTWVIVLASANMLNIDISKHLINEQEAGDNSLTSMVAKFISRFSSYDSPFDLAQFELARIAGRMAKACESLDHMERFDSRVHLEEGVIDAARLILALVSWLRMDLKSAVLSRWKQVEQKSIFFRSTNPRDTQDPSLLALL